jgi:hypothetical protein
VQFERAQAEAALDGNDLPAAARALAAAAAEPVSPEEQSRTRLLQARLLEAQGSKAAALVQYAQLARSPLEQVAAPALLRATQLRLETGAVTPESPPRRSIACDGAGAVTTPRSRPCARSGVCSWRRGRFREGLAAYRTLARSLPLDNPASMALLEEQAAAFRQLFLEGGADGLQPIRRSGFSTITGTRPRSARTAI